MKLVGLMLLTVFLASCGASIAVDYDKEKDFSEFTSYQFYTDIDSGLSQLDDNRIIKAIDSSLQKRGFQKTNSPQFYVNFYAEEVVSNSRNTLGVGVGGGGGNVGVGVSGGIPIGGRVVNQELTIDIVDASMGQSLAWQVVIEGELKEKASPEQKEAYYFSVIDKALQKFPPKKK
tara:strand:- start:40347 stop:40871 length:525 start_codon:yes stop_codon:yes gene_type:complete